MRPRCSVYIALSLDGFIAREDGAIDWLDRVNAEAPPGDDLGYGAFFATVDALVMGRKTFDTVRRFPSWPYGSKRVVVCSRTAVEIPASLAPYVTASNAEPRSLLAELGSEGIAHVYVDGGETIRRFLAADLVDELTLTTIPVLLGRGTSLWAPSAALADVPLGPGSDRWLSLVSTRSTPQGLVQSVYRGQR